MMYELIPFQLTANTMVYQIKLDGKTIAQHSKEKSARNLIKCLNHYEVKTAGDWINLVPTDIRFRFIIAFNSEKPNLPNA